MSARVIAIAMLAGTMFACQQPTLDTTGMIQCGSDTDGGTCPANYTCAFGRCCPAPLNLANCPVGLTAVEVEPFQDQCPAGYDYRWGKCCQHSSAFNACPSDLPPDPLGINFLCINGMCPSGMGCVPGANVCCPLDGGVPSAACASRSLGRPCSGNFCTGSGSADVCYSMENNVTLPDGYCSRLCTPATQSTDCAMGHCVVGYVASPPGAGLCAGDCLMPTAGQPSPCRVGSGPSDYICTSDNAALNVGVCIPDCTKLQGLCPGGRTCDPTLHACI